MQGDAAAIKTANYTNIQPSRPGTAEDAARAENARLRREILALRQQISNLQRMADLDPLLPVYNRRAFIREVNRTLYLLDRYGIPSALVFFDLNKFKSVNDRFGHAVGDDVLGLFGRVLTSQTRDCDTVARLGGDEFGLILFQMSRAEAEIKAARLMSAVTDVMAKKFPSELSVSASWGCAAFEKGEAAETLLGRADEAMYAAKAAKPGAR